MKQFTENQRLKIFREFLNKKQYDFYSIANLKQGSYSDIERGKVKVSTDLKLILNKEYSLNIDWIEKGIGAMVLNAPTPKIETQQEEITDSSSIESLKMLLSEKDKLLAAKDETIALLKKMLDK